MCCVDEVLGLLVGWCDIVVVIFVCGCDCGYVGGVVGLNVV